MIKHFIFSKVVGKVASKVLQGDTAGLKKYVKVGVAALIIGGILLFVVLVLCIWFVVSLIGWLFTQINSDTYQLDVVSRERAVEKINEVQAITPNLVTDTVAEAKDVVAPYSQMLNDGLQMIEAAKETFNRIENILP